MGAGEGRRARRAESAAQALHVSAGGQRRTPFEYAQILRALGLNLAEHDVAARYFGLADNPRLTVKQVPGRSPQPIVLDTHLRTPENARLVRRPDVRPWLVHGPEVPPARARTLMAAGAGAMGM